MRFSTAVVFAGAASAGLTTTQTQLTTITSCGPDVTSCPATATPAPVTNQTTSTIYSTQITTVIACPVTVTDCPAHSTHVKTLTIAIGTTVCDVTPTGGKYSNSTMMPPPTGTKATLPPPKETSPPKSEGPKVPACPTYSVKTISTSVTTVVPTVIYETVSIPCPGSETGKPQPSAGKPSAGNPKPTGGAGGNGTITPPPVKAGAASFGASAIFAVVAGAAAFVLA